MNDSNKLPLRRQSAGWRQTILWTSFFVGLVLAVFASATAVRIMDGCSQKAIIATQIIIQDLLAFILPAYIAGRYASSEPIHFMRLKNAPKFGAVVLAILLVIVAEPFLNLVVAWNESLSLPQSLSGLEQWLKATEETANATSRTLLEGNSLAAMVGCILLVGVLTGLSEEMFFRGTLQRILETSLMRQHIAIWTAAIIFSLLHFQFYGFVPRLLLGALFGYLTVWSGTIWTAVIAHAVNNSIVVVTSWLSENKLLTFDIDQIGVPVNNEFPFLAILSLALVILIIGRKKWFLPT